MNRISAIEERSDGHHVGRTAADDLGYGRHAVPLVEDPGDYRGKHRSDGAHPRN
jgi:hypothetical protein